MSTKQTKITDQINILKLRCGPNRVCEEMKDLLHKLMTFVLQGGSGPKDVMTLPKTYEQYKELYPLFSLDGPLSTPEAFENLLNFLNMNGVTEEYVDRVTGRIIVQFLKLTPDGVDEVMKHIEVIPMISLRDVLTVVCQSAIVKRFVHCSEFFNAVPSFQSYACGKSTSQKKKRAIIIASLEKSIGVFFVRSSENPDLRFEFGINFDLEAFLSDVIPKLGVEFIEEIQEPKTEAARDCLSAGEAARDCLSAGEAARDCLSAGEAARDCVFAGVAARDCLSAGEPARDCLSAGEAAKNDIFSKLKDFFLRNHMFQFNTLFKTDLFLELVGLQKERITQAMIDEFRKLLKSYMFTITPKTNMASPFESFSLHIDHFCLQIMKILKISTNGINIKSVIQSGRKLVTGLDEVVVCSSSITGKNCKHGSSCKFLHQKNPSANFACISWANGYTFTVCHACPDHEGSKVQQWGRPPQKCTLENCPYGHFDESVKNYLYVPYKKHKPQKPHKNEVESNETSLSEAIEEMSLGGGDAADCVRHSTDHGNGFCVSGGNACCVEVSSILHNYELIRCLNDFNVSDEKPQDSASVEDASCVVLAQFQCQRSISFSCGLVPASSKKRTSDSVQSPHEKKSRTDSLIQDLIQDGAARGVFWL